ncbi:hypothetical protein BHE74_00048248 [Ensete ventricosum]|nr:hypothetical protein GW17_00051906 [Ensete ventricosum]RWW45874.1 hypothetical protein BHE74_00048248 [Ensete ventricosum]
MTIVGSRCWNERLFIGKFERSLLATLCSEGLLLAVSKADGSWQHCVVAMCAAVEGIKGDLVPERLVGRRLKAAVRV